MAGTPNNQALTEQLDPTSDRAVFRQIADHLRSAITSGRLGEGDQLPSESQMADHYGVTRMTARQALGLLKAEGLVESQHGRGAYVRRRPLVRRLGSDRFARQHRERGKAAFLAEVEGVGAKPTVDEIVVAEERPSEDVARRLDVSPRGKVVVRSRRYLIDGQPVELATSFIPSDIARGTAIANENTGPGGIYARLEELGHRLDHYDEEVRARMPDPDEARRLRLASGVPVFHLIRTAVDAEGRPVEVCDTVMSSDVYVLEYQLPAE